MTTTAGEDLARVTIISPTRRIDLALPGAATLGEILPSIIRFSGYEGGAPNEAVHQWVLQRFGEDPLDASLQVSQLDIRDGETLHLRQLEATMPDAAFDDVVDAVATSTSTRPSWTAKHTRRMSLGMASAMIFLIPAALLITHRATITAGLTLVVAVAAAIAAFMCSRAFGRPAASAVLGWQATGLAGLGGFFLLGSVDRPIRILICAALVLLFAGLLGLGAQVSPYALLAVALAALIAVIGAMVAVLLPTHQVGIASVAMALMLAFMPMMPSLCYRLAGVAMPNLPTSAAELSTDNTPVQSDIVSRAIVADKLLGSLIAAAVIIDAIAAVPVLSWGTWRGAALCGAVALALLLRARAFVGLTQRLVLLLGGSLILIGAIVGLLLKLDNSLIRIAVGIVVAVIVSVILTSFAARTTSQKVSPFWGRIADVVEWLSLMSVVPLMLWVLNAYSWALGLKG